MAETFRRENRYLVIKHKDLDKLLRSLRDEFKGVATKVCDDIRDIRGANRACVVVESDWPEYEIVWQMIEARMDPDRVGLTPAEAAQHWKQQYLAQKAYANALASDAVRLREALADARNEIELRVREDGGDSRSVDKALGKYDAALGNKDRIAHPKQEKEGGEG